MWYLPLPYNEKYLIKSPIQFVMSVFKTFFILNAFITFCFQVSNTQLFYLQPFVGFVDFKFKFFCEF